MKAIMRDEQEMKDSGIEWIGKIPASWNIERMKNQFVYNKGLNITKADLVDEGVAVISYGQIHAKNNTGTTLNPEFLRYISPDNIAINDKSLLNMGDIVFADTSEDYDGLGNAVYMDSDTETYAGYHTIIARLKNIDYSKYFAYLFKSDAWREQLRVRASGIKVFSVTQRMLNDVTLIMPEKNAIRPIISYLDDRCGKIDALIAEAKASIEEYKELKQAVIYEAVTKGLDKNVEMKDSGVEWIDNIPANWNLVKITRILDKNHPYAIGDGDHGSIKTDQYLDSGIPFIRVQNLGWGTALNLENVVYISEEDNKQIQNSTLRPNDILFAKTGATIGKTAIMPDNIPVANTTSHVGKITLSKEHNPKYVFYVLSSQVGYRQFWDIALQKTTRPELSIEETKSIKILLPHDRSIEDDIVSYLDDKLPVFDQLIETKMALIEDLEAYKKSLIYEVVTGKRKVVE
ncbi:restriction endonuclease subunit S domain-containing protein [Schwartzia succinivorans]|uniref:Type I restriction enzyme, S subunit n=1 Tax=Schwartzia succinivorans DSM 10502 TaxID=1123243 RepID=A0A1M4UJ43_9FIRM|nr:restriction endonuclease subunit S [Schwartzia succinivorans]SHE56685.1 type I restriction enzyme, S subunit [Schwartzia succinivorans DSM 10502]